MPADAVQQNAIHDMSRFFVQRPEKVARAIGRAIGTGRTEIWTSFPTRVAAGMITAFPWMIDLAVAASRRRQRAPGA
jgi:short-subunit dehydrogenase